MALTGIDSAKVRTWLQIKNAFKALLTQCATLTGTETLTNKTMTAFKFTRKVTVKTADYTVTSADSGTSFSTDGATGAVKLTLPAAVVGLTYRFYVGATQQLQIDPNGTETIALPSTGAQSAAGKYLWADAIGESVIVECVKTGQWSVAAYIGTWTAEL